MSDIRTVWVKNHQEGDWLEVSGDLAAGDELQTAIIISLFTDRQAREDDETDDGDRRGWWGDTGSDYDAGSRLWLLKRQKLTASVARRAEDYTREALQWLLDDGVVGRVEIQAFIVWPSGLDVHIHYYRPDGVSGAVRFYQVWESANAV